MLLNFKKFRASSAIIVLCSLALAGCEVGSATKGKSPFRAPTSTNSGVSPGTSTVEVNTDFTVNVVVKDKSGYGIPNVVPTVTATTGGSSSGVTSGGCSRTDAKGNTSCTLKALLPGIYTVAVLTPVAISSATTVDVKSFPRTLTFTTQPSASTAAATAFAQQPVVTVLDKSGRFIAAGGAGSSAVTMTLTSATSGSGGTAVLSAATLTSKTADSLGVADFTANGLKINLSGTYNLTATLTNAAQGITITAQSTAFTITAGTATALKFSISPSTTTATDSPFSQQPVIIQVDAQGNQVKGENSCRVTVTLQGGDTGDQLLGSTSSLTMIDGTASFKEPVDQALKVRRVGTTNAPISTYQLLATAGGLSSDTVPVACSTKLTTALSTTFTITLAGLANQLVLIQPPSTAALNETWINQPIIGVLDVTGKFLSSDNVTRVVMSKDTTLSPGGTLVGSTSLQVVNGLAAFSGLMISSATAVDASTNTTPPVPYRYDFIGVNPGLSITGLQDVSQIVSSNGLSPTALQFRVQPQSVAINEQMATIEVKTVDSNGFFCFNDNTTQIRLRFTSGTGAMQQDLTSINPTLPVPVINGIASFSNISFTLSGAKVMRAEEGTGAASPTLIASSTFAINNHSNEADHLRFDCAAPSCQQPSDITGGGAGSPWTTQPRVSVVDKFGNVMTNDNDTKITVGCIHFPDCALNGLTQVRVTNGSARFTNLRLKNATTAAEKLGVVLDAIALPALPITDPQRSDSFNEVD